MPSYQLTIIISIVTAFLAVAMMSLMTFYMRMREKKYDYELKRVELDMMRSSLEAKVYDANDRLADNEELWKQINHLIIEAQSNSKANSLGPDRNFFESIGVDAGRISVDPKKVFVLTPFHNRYLESFMVVREACASAGLSCSRGDEEYAPGAILAHVVSQMLSARLVVANIDGRNPNVFYELGIAQAMGKPVLLITSKLDELPFDLQSQRLIVYQTVAELHAKLHESLLKIFVDSSEVDPGIIEADIRISSKQMIARPTGSYSHRQFVGFRIENHSKSSVFISSFWISLSTGNKLVVIKNEVTGELLSSRELAAGDSFIWPVSYETLKKQNVKPADITHAVVEDKIGRKYKSDSDIAGLFESIVRSEADET